MTWPHDQTPSPSTTRRRFLQDVSIAGGGLWLATRTGGYARARESSEKLNIAIIGAGGRGGSNVNSVSGENITVICDVDEKRAAGSIAKHQKARRYTDYREMLDRETEGLDAVVVSTPDHHHACAAIMAMNRGLHVYCEKPLTHNVAEARAMREAAAKSGVVTQMGTQGHSHDESRRTVEVLQSGVLGQISEVHCWTDRPSKWWPQGVDRPQEKPAVPDSLAWDLWLGPAPVRPYHPAYVPFVWRGWWDFGTGALGDMGCHVMDMAFWALKLEDPDTIQAETSDHHPESGPVWSVIRYEFPERGKLGPCALTWYDGGKKPPSELVGGAEIPGNGTILVGEQGTMFVTGHYGYPYQLQPEKQFADYQPPEITLPRAGGEHHGEWIAACKAGQPSKAMSNFAYSTRLTEMVLLGNLAVRAGQKVEWDAAKMQVTNDPSANRFVQRKYREGWSL